MLETRSDQKPPTMKCNASSMKNLVTGLPLHLNSTLPNKLLTDPQPSNDAGCSNTVTQKVDYATVETEEIDIHEQIASTDLETENSHELKLISNQPDISTPIVIAAANVELLEQDLIAIGNNNQEGHFLGETKPQKDPNKTTSGWLSDIFSMSLILYNALFPTSEYINSVPTMAIPCGWLQISVPVFRITDCYKNKVKLTRAISKASTESLHHVKTDEKNPLPSKEDLQQVKDHESFIHNLEEFDPKNLHHTSTKERKILPDTNMLAEERLRYDHLSSISSFTKIELNPIQLHEKIILPGPQMIAQEKTEQELMSGIEGFDAGKLKHTETQEKNPLPDPSAIEQEKRECEMRHSIGDFNKSKLRHSQTEVKNPLPSTEAINLEKQEVEKIQAIEGFKKDSLKHTEPTVKNVLPDQNTLEAEKKEQELKDAVTKFNRNSLKKTTTEEKNALPSSQDIAEEKAAK
ncbi:unnamed protein product [Mytilus coruscus]|uniref:Thymosin beta n=1 Tax=Mytilus coruscus TaxID=42192 RepID=A0A6J8DJZ4_MYTCO|nr:unnamed protein product [Mytilus coruscus]